MRALAAALMLVALAGCSREKQDAAAADSASAGERLESAAIATGVVTDPASADLTGVYSRGTDAICIVPAARDFAIGIRVDYGDGQGCTARGGVSRDGATLHIAIGDGGCRFDARFDGDRIALPGIVPAACDSVCTGRASLTALSVDRLSNSLSEAQALPARGARPLCGG